MLTGPEKHARCRAIEFELFAAGIDDAGQPETARRLRLAAQDLQDVTETLEAERSARRALQERAERLQAIVGQAAHNAPVTETDRQLLDRIGDEVLDGSRRPK